MTVICGDCVEVMAGMPAASVDAIVCDPPYGLEFMGKEWDRIGDTGASLGAAKVAYAQPGGNNAGFFNHTGHARLGMEWKPGAAKAMQGWHERWAREALRVLKPGGHLLAFGGTRTYHRLTCAIEDAGFEVRDCLSYMYGSGFPKSLDVSKAIGKVAPDAARQWDGWGTALKPAWEPVVVARKPLVGTVAANVQQHGTGGLNIAASRVAFRDGHDEAETKTKNQHGQFDSGPRTNEVFGSDGRDRADYAAPGRWPANVLLGHDDDCVQVGTRQVASNGHYPAARPAGSAVAGAAGHGGQDGLAERSTRGEMQADWDCVPGCPVRLLDEQTGALISGRLDRANITAPNQTYGAAPLARTGVYEQDSGGASRFFYTAKTSRAERNAGLDDHDPQAFGWSGGAANAATRGETYNRDTETNRSGINRTTMRRNIHPTVKPIALMRWLVRLVTPPGGVVLDPFTGSGTTGCAAALEGFRFIGIEQDAGYVAIADARIAFWTEHGDDGLRIVAERDAAAQRRVERSEAGQLDLLA